MGCEMEMYEMLIHNFRLQIMNHLMEFLNQLYGFYQTDRTN